MLRLSLKKCVVGLAVIAALVIPSTFVPRAFSAQRSVQKYYPPLMQGWEIRKLKSQGNMTEYTVALNYPGFLGADYPAIGKRDVVPAMWSRLILPSGVELMKSGVYKSHFSDSGYRNQFGHRIPKTNLRWQKGLRPTWKVLNVNGGVLPRVTFWLTGQPGQCFKATTQGMYRHKKHWIRIPHAPVQTSQNCLPASPPTTTTTSTTTTTTG